jgi:hypothetical protein
MNVTTVLQCREELCRGDAAAYVFPDVNIVC